MSAQMNHTIDITGSNGYGRCEVVPVWISVSHYAERVFMFPHFYMSYSLTVREKEHWKDRIAARIDKRIDALCAVQPGFIGKVDKKARERALDAAGLLEMHQAIDKIGDDYESLHEKSIKLSDEVDKKHRAVDAKMEPLIEKAIAELSDLRNRSGRRKRQIDEKAEPVFVEISKQKERLRTRKKKAFREILAKIQGVPLREVDDPYSPESVVERSIKAQKGVEVDKILTETPRGKEILALREEKENLLDTVWLATSGKQIKELWDTVNSLLGNSQTKLQSKAAAIEPSEEDHE